MRISQLIIALTISLVGTGAEAACLNNTIEFRNDINDGTYFHAQKYGTTILPQEAFRSLDGKLWFAEEPDDISGSQLDPKYALAWSIEVHYSDDAIDSIGQWKYSKLTGNRYAVLRGKHVPSPLRLDYPPTFRSQTNTHLSLLHADRMDEWDKLETLTTDILADRNGHSVPGYGKLERSSPPDQIIGKLSKWIKNKRLAVLMDGGGNVDGFIHPVDFMLEAPSFCQGAASALTMMAAQLGIPARLGETVDHSWVELLIDGKWRLAENQPETFLDVIDPPVPVWTYAREGKEHRGYQPKSPGAMADALEREALLSGGLIDIMASPGDYGLVDGANRYSWFFDWSSPFVYGVDGEVLNGEAGLSFRPEVYSDSIFNYYPCSYTDKHNSSQCGGAGRQFQIAEWYGSVWELAALYPGREDDLPYVFAKDAGGDSNIMYLTPIRHNRFSNATMAQSKIDAGGSVRKQFYLSDVDDIEAVYAVLYLGPDDNLDHTLPQGGGNWYYKINGRQVDLSAINGLGRGDRTSNGIETNYLGLGQTVLRYKLDAKDLISSKQGCS